MILNLRAEHGIASLHAEPAIAHVTFENEVGMAVFLADNRQNIGSRYERSDAEFRPMLTITPKTE